MGSNERLLYRKQQWRPMVSGRDPASGQPAVKHVPNEASGGQTTVTELGTFLAGGAHAPARRELLLLIATLLVAHDFASERSSSDEGPEREHREEAGSYEVDDLARRHGISNDQASRLIRQVGPDRDRLDFEAPS